MEAMGGVLEQFEHQKDEVGSASGTADRDVNRSLLSSSGLRQATVHVARR